MDIFMFLIGMLGINATLLLMIGVAIADGVDNHYVADKLTDWLIRTVLAVVVSLVYGISRIAWALVQ